MPLDPESEQVREVFAHYGRAMYAAQCLEQSIFQHLVFFDLFPKTIAAHTTPDNWTANFDQYEARELGQTMGKLVRRLQQVGQSTEAVERLLAQALKDRNWLAHGYFSDRAVEFTVPSGRLEMIEELKTISDQFFSCTNEIDVVWLPVARAYGYSEEVGKKHEEELTAAYIRRTAT